MRIRATAVAALALSLLGALALPARAADAAVLAAFERSLDPLEKAILSSVLADPANDAAFAADMAEARKDAAGLAAAASKWRMKLAQFAAAERSAPNPDLEGTYRAYPEMLTAPTRGYLARRLRDLRERGAAGDAQAKSAYDTLRDYLAAVQNALDDNNGKLTWYTKKVVAGIMDKYRSELVEYLGTNNARQGLREGPAAAKLLDLRRAAASAPAQPAADGDAERRRAEAERQRRERLARENAKPDQPGAPAPAEPPREPVAETPRGPVAEPPRQPADGGAPRDAREQAEAAERTAGSGRPGETFDGGGLQVPGADPVAVPAPGGEPRPAPAPGALTPSVGSGSGPRLGAGPAVPPLTAEDELLGSIRGAQGKGSKSWLEQAPKLAGALALGAGGLLLGGPIAGALGLIAGFFLGGSIASRLFK